MLKHIYKKRNNIFLKQIYHTVFYLFIYIFSSYITVQAASIPVGNGNQYVQIKDVSFQVFTYKPLCTVKEILIVFHGSGRNSDKYRKNARKIADKHCMVIVAPVFEKDIFPKWRYQFGGIFHKGKQQPLSSWGLNYVDALIAWVRQEEGGNLPVSLIGHSAGGQFLSRLTAFSNIQAHKIIIANPSTYVWPDLTIKAPFGLGNVYSESQGNRALENYLKASVVIILGEEDTGSDGRDNSVNAVKQGLTRYERGKNVFAAAQEVSRRNGYVLNWKLITLKGVGHSSRKVFQSSEVINLFEQ